MEAKLFRADKSHGGITVYTVQSQLYGTCVRGNLKITVRHNRRVTVIARADVSSKYASNSVVVLSENMGLYSHLPIIFIPFNASSDMHFHILYAIPRP